MPARMPVLISAARERLGHRPAGEERRAGVAAQQPALQRNVLLRRAGRAGPGRVRQGPGGEMLPPHPHRGVAFLVHAPKDFHAVGVRLPHLRPQVGGHDAAVGLARKLLHHLAVLRGVVIVRAVRRHRPPAAALVGAVVELHHRPADQPGCLPVAADHPAHVAGEGRLVQPVLRVERLLLRGRDGIAQRVAGDIARRHFADGKDRNRRHQQADDQKDHPAHQKFDHTLAPFAARSRSGPASPWPGMIPASRKKFSSSRRPAGWSSSYASGWNCVPNRGSSACASA